MNLNDLGAFIEECKDLSEKEVKKKIGKKRSYKSRDWLNIWFFIYWMYYDEGCLRYECLMIMALGKAKQTAESLEDWVRIEERAMDEDSRNRAFNEILKFDITEKEPIRLLFSSCSDRLRAIGEYLKGKFLLK